MRRLLLATTCLCLPGIAAAADFPLTAPVTEAVIYLQGTTILRSETIDLPSGEHRLLVPVSAGPDTIPEVSLQGATLLSVESLPNAVMDGRRFLTTDQRAAYDAFQEAQNATRLAEDAQIRTAADLKAAEDALALLRSLTGTDLAGMEADALIATVTAVSTRIGVAEVARADARAALRSADEALADASLVTQQAKRDLDATGVRLGPVNLLAVSVEVPEAGAVTLDLESFGFGGGWSTQYDLDLAADGTVTLDRKVAIRQETGLPLSDVALTLSTADPFARTAPQEVPPNQAQIVDPVERPRLQADAGVAFEQALTRAAPAPAIVEARSLSANFDGPVVTYTYPTPVSLPVQQGQIVLALDTLTLDGRVFNRAAPRFDETAYLMAEVTNSTGEPLLAGPATLFREGSRIGEAQLPLLAAGDETELAFGALQHLRLSFALLENETGDRGIFVTSGTRQQDMVFRVRNLSDSAESVEALFALPFSEQEDLEVTLRTEPNPDARDVDDARGVARWDLEVPPGGEAEVRISVAMQWPEDKRLIWQP